MGSGTPLDAVANVCADHDVWLYADGACAGGAILPERRHRYRGLERVDSVTIDPDKWLSVPYSCGAVLFADRDPQARSFSMHADSPDFTEEETYHGQNFHMLAPEMSRPFRALKLRMSLKHRGVEGDRTTLDRSCECAEHLHLRVAADNDFETLPESNLLTHSFRDRTADPHVADAEQADPAGVEDYLDHLNQRIADDLRLTGQTYVTTTEVAGKTASRLSTCSHRTTTEDIDRTFDARRAHGERIDDAVRDRLDAQPVEE